MIKVKSYAALSSNSLLKPHGIERRECNADDVLIKIEYCGVCHSDIHMARNEWRESSIYPLVPGHEIIGVHSCSAGGNECYPGVRHEETTF